MTRLLGAAVGIATAVILCLVIAGALLANCFVAGRMTVAAANLGWVPNLFAVVGRIGIPGNNSVNHDQEGPEYSTDSQQGESLKLQAKSDGPLNAIILSTALSILYILFGNFRDLLTFNGLG